METRIDTIVRGNTACYLLRAEGTVLIDTGGPKQGDKLVSELAKLGVAASDIGLVVLTHGHFDHIGSAAEIAGLTGAPLALHGLERAALEQSKIILAPGVTAWGRALGGLLSLLTPLIKIPPASVDVLLDDDDLSLADYGIPGSVVSTPGHSRGSVSVVLDSGDAFVGDLAMNGLPSFGGPGFPIFAEDLGALRASWRKLLDRGVSSVYPSHGKPFAAAAIEASLA